MSTRHNASTYRGWSTWERRTFAGSRAVGTWYYGERFNERVGGVTMASVRKQINDRIMARSDWATAI